jgi:hypothetical protein
VIRTGRSSSGLRPSCRETFGIPIVYPSGDAPSTLRAGEEETIHHRGHKVESSRPRREARRGEEKEKAEEEEEEGEEVKASTDYTDYGITQMKKKPEEEREDFARFDLLRTSLTCSCGFFPALLLLASLFLSV